eukprot:TRINITY_DN32108_c0_g1_i1.p1 TRINITY_DN32108_c0_g1~~TRINITY_DN32108_c0_g1_i1.p1  ORF type:complete len:253 (+),score=38.95 TRINITY_DN32108_c0_g1_i1:82-840(+)
MGTVHAVSLKYVAIAGMAGAGAYCMIDEELLQGPPNSASNGLRLGALLTLWNMSIVNGMIAVLFNAQVGMSFLGKDVVTGAIPAWSYFCFFTFHIPTFLYTKVQRIRDRGIGVEPADEVAPGWWVGGRYASELGKTWAGNIDLTCEFPELCKQDRYHLVRCWDGVPPRPDELEEAARFGISARRQGEVLVHCAHGRGRSTTTMCACLVKAGLFSSWQEAFEAIKKRRNVCKLNKSMKAALTVWQEEHHKKAK